MKKRVLLFQELERDKEGLQVYQTTARSWLLIKMEFPQQSQGQHSDGNPNILPLPSMYNVEGLCTLQTSPGKEMDIAFLKKKHTS